MAAAEKRGPDAATLDLWRVAEIGDVDALAPVLQRVSDINARNEHGVTALMRAAQSGHVRMVRALLEHGADANITRNDKFTALALAAFFGHTGVVRALMENGADSQASTRHSTSPHMWATARTFNEVVNQLERPAPPEKVSPPKRNEPVAPIARAVGPRPTLVPHAADAGPVTRAVVRTLKDPPEIWDLVHEVPRGFDARTAFKSRLMEAGMAFRLAAIAILIGAGVIGVLVLRGVQARSERNSELQREAAAAVEAPAHVPEPAAVTPEAVDATPFNFEAAAPSNSSITKASERPVVVYPKRNSRSSWRSPDEIKSEPRRAEAAVTKIVEPGITVEKSELPKRSGAFSKNKSTTSLSPQLITPAKSSTAKGKVIQWP